jgi:hypothetical protein
MRMNSETGRAEKQLTRYLRKQPGGSLRGVPAPKKPASGRPYEAPIVAQRKYLAARGKGDAQHQRNLSLIREYEANPYPKSQPLGHGIAGKIGMEALDLTTGIPSLMHQIHSMRSHRGNVGAEVQPGNVLPLIGGLRGPKSHLSIPANWARPKPRPYLVAGAVGLNFARAPLRATGHLPRVLGGGKSKSTPPYPRWWDAPAVERRRPHQQ